MEDVNKHNIFTELRSPNILERVMTEYTPFIEKDYTRNDQIRYMGPLNFWGMAHTISRYIDWPQDKPFPFIMQHSFPQIPSDVPLPDEKTWLNYMDSWKSKLPKFRPLYWVWGKGEFNPYRLKHPYTPFKPFALGNPLIYAKNNFKGKRKGTIIIPENLSRANVLVDNETRRVTVFRNYDSILKALENLPDKFHPIDICLRFDDLELVIRPGKRDESASREVKSYISELESRGFNLVCVGFKHDNYFQERQLTLFSQYEYACVDHYLNSSKAYALYAGCKFFHPGDLTWDSPLNPKWWYKDKIVNHLGTMEHKTPDEHNPWGRPIFHEGKELFHLDNVEWSHKNKKAKDLINWRMGVDCKRTPEEILKLIEEEVILC